MKRQQCPKCSQFTGRAPHRCPTGVAVKAPAPVSVPAGTPPGGSPPSAGGAGYGAVYETYLAKSGRTAASQPEDAPTPVQVRSPTPSLAPRDHTRFGKQFEYHGHVAVAVEEAKRALSTHVDSGDAFDPRGAASAIRKVAARVAQWRPSRNDVPVYAPQTRKLAEEVAAIETVKHGEMVIPDYLVFEDGKARYVRPRVARLLTAVRDDLKNSAALQKAAQVEHQRATARAALQHSA